MELVNFSVTNFRSITKAHKVSISDTTVLIGRNNEGKSNLLRALDVAMSSLQRHAIEHRYGRLGVRSLSRRDEKTFYWERDFPINLQSRKSGTQTIIRLEFLLNDDEVTEFKNEIKSNVNGTLPIIIKIGKDSIPGIEVSKKGKGSKTLNSKSGQIANFIANKIIFNYIPAVRTDQEAIDVVGRMLSQRLRVLEDDSTYLTALKTIKDLQQPILDSLSERIKEPLEKFLPGINSVSIEIPDDTRRNSLRRDFEIIVDDGTPTSLAFKGDGVKSLAALGLLKDRVRTDGASIIAIEEPESHLHPAAIHQLLKVIKSLGEENQVILSTHNPLFVDRQDIKSNIIIDKGAATPAKSIKQIRDLLGIKASDNLTNANFVLVVEGEDDAIALTALFKILSNKLRQMIENHMLIVEPIGGAGNLTYKLSLLKNSLCVYHTFLDNDDAGRNAYASAEQETLLDIKSNTFVNCNGSRNSEFEDCLDPLLYKEKIKEEYGVNLDCKEFRGSDKWSDRVRKAFLAQGKQWTSSVEAKVKYTVANCVKKSPENALSQHKRNSVDALVVSLEQMIGGK
ncbi:TPA: ATP-dependent endonuclease [Enterobacter chuandaensis]